MNIKIFREFLILPNMLIVRYILSDSHKLKAENLTQKFKEAKKIKIF